MKRAIGVHSRIEHMKEEIGRDFRRLGKIGHKFEKSGEVYKDATAKEIP